MGKKSKKGVTRAGTKTHPGAGNSRAKAGRGKSDASSRASSRDNISVDENPDLTRLASESKAPTGPPPKDVVAVVNNLVAAQQLNGEAAAAELVEVVASGMSNGSSNKENKSAEPTMDSKTHPAPEAEDEIANIGEVDDSPPYLGDVADSEDKEDDHPTVEELLNAEENEAAEPPKEEDIVPVVETAKLQVISPVTSPAEVAEQSKPAVLEPESLEGPAAAPDAEKLEEPAAPTVETAKVENAAVVEPEKAKDEVRDSNVNEVPSNPIPPPSQATAKDAVEESAAPIVEEVAVAEPEKPKVEEVPESSGIEVPLNPIPPASEATVKEAAPDVWSQKLRDVVAEEPTKPVLDVTPPKKSTSRSAAPLDLPSAPEAEVQQTDCGCLIL